MSMRVSDSCAMPGSKWRVVVETLVILYLYYCLVGVFQILPPVALKSLGLHLDLRPGTAITLGGVLLAELIALGGVRLYYKRKGIALAQLGWQLPANKGTTLVLALAAALLYIGYTLQIPEVRENFTEVSLFRMWGLVVGVGAGFLEEIVFRGYVMTRLQQVGIVPAVQVLLAAVAFSLLHIGFGFVGVLCTFVVGLALGGLYLLGRRSLLGPVVCHGLINAAIEPWLLLWLLRFYAEKFA